MTPVQQSAVVLLLSLLENTLWDVALCHNALLTTRQVRPSLKIYLVVFLPKYLISMNWYVQKS